MLETHIYDMREKLFSDEGVLLTTEEEREKIDQALNEASDWLDDEGWDSTADVSLKPLLLQLTFNLVPSLSLLFRNCFSRRQRLTNWGEG